MEAGQGPLRGLGSGSWQKTHGPFLLGSGGEFVKLLFTKLEEWYGEDSAIRLQNSCLENPMEGGA